MNPLLFLRVTYMENYDGPGETYGGGSFIAEHGTGGEVFNFAPYHGKCYGYGMTRNHAGINLEFLDGTNEWAQGDELGDVDVVFFARSRNGGQVIVGWYDRATVFHKQYRTRRGSIPGMNYQGISYVCHVPAERAYLIEESARSELVPLAAIDGKGFSGQANVWYPCAERNDNAATRRYVARISRYLARVRSAKGRSLPVSAPGFHPGGKWSKSKSDPEHNSRVERAAIDFARSSFEKRGYKVDSVEDENRGWDLEATRGKSKILIEVKGQSGPSIYFELTPNEYSKLKNFQRNFCVFLVCEALHAPTAYEFVATGRAPELMLKCSKPKVSIPLREKTAAVAREVVGESEISE
jgi:hypothetical protein